MNRIDLSQKNAIVTGAGQGLGRAIAESLYAAGAKVAINFFENEADASGISNRSQAEEVAAALGDRAVALPADVRDPTAIADLFEQIESRWGQVDIVVNNAGITRDRTVRNMTSDQWQQVIDTNLTGVFNMCQQASHSLADGGRIVSLASLSAVVGTYGQANYAAAKAGVMSLTKVLSRELAKQSITVNAVAPGVVLTEMGKAIPDKVQRQMLDQIPLGRFGEPDEIASVVLFLCSDLASYVSGQTIHVNGGWWS